MQLAGVQFGGLQQFGTETPKQNGEPFSLRSNLGCADCCVRTWLKNVQSQTLLCFVTRRGNSEKRKHFSYACNYPEIQTNSRPKEKDSRPIGLAWEKAPFPV